MKDETLTDSVLRQFLLNNVHDEQRQRIESLFLTDSMLRERVLAAEQELIDDYLEDSLSVPDKDKFRSLYARTPEQQRKLRITKTVKDWAVAESSAQDRTAAELDRTGALAGSPVRKPFRWRATFVIPIAAVIIVVIVLGVLWFNRRMEQRSHADLEREVALLNSPSNLRATPPQSDALTLRPLTLRSGASVPELKPLADSRSAEVRLLSLQNERHPKYQVVVRRLSDDQSITIRDVVAADEGKTIRLLLPRHFLTRGLYQIDLSGSATEGSVTSPEEYQFTVRN